MLCVYVFVCVCPFVCVCVCVCVCVYVYQVSALSKTLKAMLLVNHQRQYAKLTCQSSKLSGLEKETILLSAAQQVCRSIQSCIMQ